MRDRVFSCFSSESNVKTTPNLVASTYQTKLRGRARVITVTWCRNVMGQGRLCVAVGEPASKFVCKVELKAWRKHGSCRSSDIIDGSRIEVFWDVVSARFVSGPEPERGYYVSVVCNGEVVLLLGDMEAEAYRKTKSSPSGRIEAILVSRKVHVLGEECFSTLVRFGIGGRSHELSIECRTKGAGDPELVISVDREVAVEVNHLQWKFRGNGTIHVEGVPVQIFWDVYDWLFNPGLGHHASFICKSTMPLDSLSSKDDVDCGHASDFPLFICAWK